MEGQSDSDWLSCPLAGGTFWQIQRGKEKHFGDLYTKKKNYVTKYSYL